MTTELQKLRAEFDDLRKQMRQLAAGHAHAAKLGTTLSMLPADVTVNDDGSITLNTRLTFLNPFDINTTGVGTITVLPDESLAQFLPLLGIGPSGLPPNFDVPTLHPVAYGTALPDPPMTMTLVDPGDATASPPVAPTWHIEVWIHSGQTGPAGTPVNVADLGDITGLSGSPPRPLDTSMLIYRSSDGKWHCEPTRVSTFAACTAFTDNTGAAGNATLGSLTLAAQPWAQRPVCDAQVQINPATDITGGYTHIELLARLGATDGPIIGRGAALDTINPYLCTLGPTQLAAGSSAVIAAGQPGQIYLMAVNTGYQLGVWSTTCSNGARFTATGLALL